MLPNNELVAPRHETKSALLQVLGWTDVWNWAIGAISERSALTGEFNRSLQHILRTSQLASDREQGLSRPFIELPAMALSLA
jgi:hypothetical protein